MKSNDSNKELKIFLHLPSGKERNKQEMNYDDKIIKLGNDELVRANSILINLINGEIYPIEKLVLSFKINF
jgi:hypothetical protein